MAVREIQRIQPTGQKSSYRVIMWGFLPVCLVFAGGMLSYISSCGSDAPGLLLPLIFSIFSLGCMEAGEALGRKNVAWRLLALLPWLAVLILTGGSCVSGQAVWMNVLIARWNQLHEAAISLLPVKNAGEGLEAAALLMTVLQAEMVWLLVYGRRKLALGVYSLFWILLLLLEQAFSPVACGLLLAGLFGSYLTGDYRETSLRIRTWILGIVAVLGVCALVLPQKELDGVRAAREASLHQIHALRYGEDTLPEGDLQKADTLRENEKELMSVQSGQEKDLYLKGFVGGVLKDGRWEALPDSAYGGEDAGILKWLKEQNFDPLKQPARYYALCDESNRPESNGVLIRVQAGNRYYFYAPASANQIVLGESKEERDHTLLSQGLLGQRQYKIEEVSEARPFELTIVEDWVRTPQNEEQQKYSEAEAVYRDFVYRHYRTVDDGLDALMQEWFWEDYETEGDGIYSAISHIRQKLTEGVQYTDTPGKAPEGTEAVRWFLTESRKGNAMLYASAAVEAFRSHGIPARYVEGYYLSASDLAESSDGTVELTGKNTHAWAEVYFDGIGWLPVDVTPGYYYDALRLQQMVGVPDAVHKTAALEDSEFGADEVNNTEGGSRGTPDGNKTALETGKTVLGVAALLVILYTLLLSGAELVRGLRMWKLERLLSRADATERAVRVEEIMYSMLKLLGCDASLGWGTEETDRDLTERFPNIESGEYSRACELIEKSVYGDVPLEAYEERILFGFLDKLGNIGKKSRWGVRMRIRYLIF